MNHIESQESTSSNDDTNLISELLNTAEVMQHQASSMATGSDGGIVNNQLQQKCLQNQNSNNEISASCYQASKEKIDIELSQNNNGRGFLNSDSYTDTENFNKLHNIRHVHIPYILNGELYQIQTQDGENVTVKCCHCPPDRVYRGSVRSTGNFHMHIKRRHPDLLEKLHDMKVTALLERRDRLMRNRKITHRHNRNHRTHNPLAVQPNDLCSYKNEEKPELLPASDSQMESTPELSLMHTHKLKIKAVFQRHQMQQREAAEMRNWNNADYVVMPIDKLPTNEESEQPINYSLKTLVHTEIQTTLNTTETQNIQQQEKENRKSEEDTNLTAFNNFASFTNPPTTSNHTTNSIPQQNDYICENHRNFSTPSISISCPSIMSNYSSNHQYELDTNRSYNSLPLHLNNLSIIKPENLTSSLSNDSEAIDLTIHTDSGIFSNSDDSAASLQHNESENSININRANDVNSKTTTNAPVTAIEVERNVDNINSNISNSAKWQELLMQVENSLRDIQREMNVRNQIESNRMFLDIAKFKFLNPGFQFNW